MISDKKKKRRFIRSNLQHINKVLFNHKEININLTIAYEFLSKYKHYSLNRKYKQLNKSLRSNNEVLRYNNYGGMFQPGLRSINIQMKLNKSKQTIYHKWY